MSRYTQHVDRRRSNERTSREGRSYEDRRQIVCYKCNNFEHIGQNCRALVDEQNPRSKTSVCQLSNNFRHKSKYCIMDRIFKDRRNNGRNFRNRRNDGRNDRNDRRNHQKEFKS